MTLRPYAAASLFLIGTLAACDGRPRADVTTPERQKHSGPALVILDLAAGVPEQASGSLLSLAQRPGTFDELVLRIAEIGSDRDAKGVFVRFGDAPMGLARATEIGEALEAVKQLGKPVFCHGDGFGNATIYAAARGCTKVWISPAGEVETIGLAAEMIYLHKLLAEELHVSIDILQVGKFKGAEEPLTRDGPSDAARSSLTGTLASMRESWVAGIREARGDTASAAIEDGPYSPARAKALKLVDEVGYADDAREEARSACGAVRDEIRFGRGSTTDDAELDSLVHLLVGGASGAPIALVRATGSISMGGQESILGSSDGITEHALSRILRKLEKDDDVRAVVLRIDSPGGSALASDLLWHRLMRLRAKKPLVVSVGDMAASGGYYLASAGNVIFAEPGSIVGSMGVVGGKLAFGRALSQVGVHSEVFPANSQPTAGARAAYPSMFAEWDDATRARVLESMTSVYDLFLSRVAEGRGVAVDKVAPSAEGRIFSGTQARERGLIDAIGGLGAALAKARELAKLPADAEFEAIGAPHGLLATLGGVATRTAAVDPEALAELAPRGDALRRAVGRLAPDVAPFVDSLSSLANGEKALAVIPYVIIIR